MNHVGWTHLPVLQFTQGQSNKGRQQAINSVLPTLHYSLDILSIRLKEVTILFLLIKLPLASL
jgi:hypothetical protein